MKKALRGMFTGLLLLSLSLFLLPTPSSAKEQETRTMAIVFDNSGSMYVNGELAWCRATYAMEVFASMLNDGDVLYIYPMNPFTVDGKEYTMDTPLKITDPSQSKKIRSIYTDNPDGTPIESIDAAAQGLLKAEGDHKYLIVLTDGSSFYQDGAELSPSATQSALTNSVSQYAGQGMDMLYLGIGSNVAMPSNPETEHFTKAQASDSKNVLSTLTQMCNLIFGRDTLPQSHLKGDTIDFDISLKKLIVFVQGANVSNVAVSGPNGTVGTEAGSAEVQYASNGCGRYQPSADKSLQGRMITYTDCAPGTYTISYSGTASDVKVYYEPDADLAMEFTGPDGYAVDPNALYEGDYTVSFGMKDAKTGELIDSDLLGTVSYTGSYSVNGQEYPVSCSGMSGAETITLRVGDTFSASLTATYLSGYTITKGTSDFGWPSGGLSVTARPAGDLQLEITGMGGVYDLAKLTQAEPAIAKVYYQGELLTGSALESVEITWDPESSGAYLWKNPQEEYYEIVFDHRDPDDPAATPVGTFSFPMTAHYTPQGSEEAISPPVEFSYTIEDHGVAVDVRLIADQTYYQISKLGEGAAIRAELSSDGKPLTAEQMELTTFTADCGGIPFTLEKCPEDSVILIHLDTAEGLKKGDYTISGEATMEDAIGRTATDSDSANVTLGRWPGWVRWVALAVALLILLAIILFILHIKALPRKIQSRKADSHMTYDGDDVSPNASFRSTMGKNWFQTQASFGGKKTGLQMEVRPASDSYVRTPQKKRKANVLSGSVKKMGNTPIQEATIAGVRYVLNEETNKLERVPPSDRPFPIRNGSTITYSGVMNDAGVEKPFTVTTKLSVRRK